MIRNWSALEDPVLPRMRVSSQVMMVVVTAAFDGLMRCTRLALSVYLLFLTCTNIPTL